MRALALDSGIGRVLDLHVQTFDSAERWLSDTWRDGAAQARDGGA